MRWPSQDLAYRHYAGEIDLPWQQYIALSDREEAERLGAERRAARRQQSRLRARLPKMGLPA